MVHHGTATWLCPNDDTEWSLRAELHPGNLDPTVRGDGDCCPTCGEECDQVNWQPDTSAGYEAWLVAPEGVC